MYALNVGSGEVRVSDDPDSVLVARGIAASMAVSAYDAAAKVGGILHFELPDAEPGQMLIADARGRYADTGIHALLEELHRCGGDRNRLQVRLVGGSKLEAYGPDTGKRNYLAVRKTLWKLGIFITAEAVGGTGLRTASLDIGTGKVWIIDTAAQAPSAAAAPRAGEATGGLQCATVS